MKVATNMFGSEEANLLLDANETGLKLTGIVCQLIDLVGLKSILSDIKTNHIKIITRKGTVGSWYKQYNKGEIPEKKGRYARAPLPLDWIKNIKSTSKTSHKMEVQFEKRKIDIEIHTVPGDDLHTKLYVFDKGFVITSGNVTEHGTFLRHLEMGVLITDRDNKLEVEIVKQWFEDRWNDKERSCLGIRVCKTMDFAKKIIEKSLREEIQENKKKHEDSEFYFSNRLFCFGCDEGRNGKIIEREIKIDGKKYHEQICKGCDQVLKKIRNFLPNFVQEISHEGRIVWRISKEYYENKYTWLYHYDTYDEDNNTISFNMTDNGSVDKVIQALVASKIESAYICLNCGGPLQKNYQICPNCGGSTKTHLFGI